MATATSPTACVDHQVQELNDLFVEFGRVREERKKLAYKLKGGFSEDNLRRLQAERDDSFSRAAADQSNPTSRQFAEKKAEFLEFSAARKELMDRDAELSHLEASIRQKLLS